MKTLPSSVLLPAPFASGDSSPAPEPVLNPVTGDRMTVLQSTLGTPHTEAVFLIELPPGSEGTPLHYHGNIEESFECVSGRLMMQIGSDTAPLVLMAGEQVAIPARTVHRFWNPFPEPVSFISRVDPATTFELFLRAHFALGRRGLTTATGMPRSLLQTAWLLHWADFFVPGVPHVAQRLLLGLLCRIARKRSVDMLLRDLIA